jgi:hypothetical protein
VVWLLVFSGNSFYLTPPPAQAQAHDTQAQAHAHSAQAQTQLAPLFAGWCDVWGGFAGMMEFANFSMLRTMFPEVFSSDVAMLLAKSAPGIAGGLADCAGMFVFGL